MTDHSQDLERMLATRGFSRNNKNLTIRYIENNGIYLGIDGNGHIHLRGLNKNNPFLRSILKKQIEEYKIELATSFFSFFSNNELKVRFLSDLLDNNKFPQEILSRMTEEEQSVILTDGTLRTIITQYTESHALIHRTLNQLKSRTM